MKRLLLALVAAALLAAPCVHAGRIIALKAAAVGGGSQAIAWTPALANAGGGAIGTVTGFNIKWGTTSGVQGAGYANTQFVSGGSTASGTATGLPTGVPIYMTVVATDGTNEAPASFEVVFTL